MCNFILPDTTLLSHFLVVLFPWHMCPSHVFSVRFLVLTFASHTCPWHALYIIHAFTWHAIFTTFLRVARGFFFLLRAFTSYAILTTFFRDHEPLYALASVPTLSHLNQMFFWDQAQRQIRCHFFVACGAPFSYCAHLRTTVSKPPFSVTTNHLPHFLVLASLSHLYHIYQWGKPPGSVKQKKGPY